MKTMCFPNVLVFNHDFDLKTTFPQIIPYGSVFPIRLLPLTPSDSGSVPLQALLQALVLLDGSFVHWSN